MKVLVTGGTGFLGKRLAFRLQELGEDVTILGRNQAIGQQLASQGFRFLPVDLVDTKATVDACQGQDYIFHCGALSSPWGKYQDFYQANVLGTRNIIQGSKVHQVRRLIHVSTSAVYFDFSHRFQLSEKALLPAKQVNAYAQTKQLAEAEIQGACQQGLPAITIRPRGIFGPGDTAIFPRLIRANQRMGIPLINEGKALIDVTYIDNVVEALLLCKQAPDSLLGRTYNITNDQPITVAQLLKILFQTLDVSLKVRRISYPVAYGLAAGMELGAKIMRLDKEPLLTRYTVGLLAKSQTLDITIAKEELGYQPCVRIEDGLARFAQWWQQNKCYEP
ncbi:MAG: NAD-dependent epimerase/dehydratase family protein [Actinomycetota bacterium]